MTQQSPASASTSAGTAVSQLLLNERLGPLRWFLGDWEGNVGVDLSYHNKEDETAETGFFEKASFHPIPIVENGKQTMHGVTYKSVAWRHGEEQLDPFHDEVGYLLWEPETGQVLRCFAVPRGLAILAGGDATPDSTTLTFTADPGSSTYGLCQNKYLKRRAEVTAFTSVFTLDGEDTYSYTSDLAMTLAAIDTQMHHTDRNTLHRVSSEVTWPHKL